MLIVLVLAFMYRDRLEGSVRDLFSRDTEEALKGEAFTYEAGAGQVFALVGDGLAVATVSGAQLLDAKGFTITRQIFAMNTPAIAVSGDSCAVFDIGGTALRIIELDGDVWELDRQQPIVSVTMNESGWIAVVTEEPGYKGHVTVFDSKRNPAYELYSGSGGAGYILFARVAPDNRQLALLSATSTGSRVSLFLLNDRSEEPAAFFDAEGELLFDFDYFGSNRIGAISDQRLVFLGGDTRLIGEYSFAGEHLQDYDIHGGSFAAVVLNRYRSSGEGQLLTVSSNGSLLGKRTFEGETLSLSPKGSMLLVLRPNSMELYSSTLEPLGSRSDTVGARGALLRRSREALLLSAYSAETHKF